MIIKSKTPFKLYVQTVQYFRDFYSGKVPIECDEECSNNCKGEHGFYTLPQEYSNLFKEKY